MKLRVPRRTWFLPALLSLAGAPLWSQTIKPADRVRVSAPTIFAGSFEGRYSGSIGDTLIINGLTAMRVPAAAVTRVQIRGSKSRGASKGALIGAGVGIGIGVVYASDGLSAGLQLVPTGALVGALVGAARSAWTDVLVPVFSDVPVVAAGAPRRLESTPVAPPTPTSEPARVDSQRVAAIDSNRSLVIRPRPMKPPLPPGFFGDQLSAGARAGVVGGTIGAASGLAIWAVAAKKPGDDLGVIAAPAVGFLAGYLVATPIGVYRYSNKRGVRASIAAPIAGALVGSLGFVGAGFPFFITVPMGSAWAHNKARSADAPPP